MPNIPDDMAISDVDTDEKTLTEEQHALHPPPLPPS